MIESQAFQDAVAAPTSRTRFIREPERPYTPAAKPRLPDRVREAIRTVQELHGHKDVTTTMIYTHVLNRRGRDVVSPADRLWRPPG